MKTIIKLFLLIGLTSCIREPNKVNQFLVNQEHKHHNGDEIIKTELFICDDFDKPYQIHRYQLVYTNEFVTVMDSLQFYLDVEMKKVEKYKEILSK